ncbi:MAG: SUMF1/EgtB/PvdO family nonheme iron enzyme, partial [Nitrosopumilus sp.]
MSESNQIDINSLHQTVLLETENDSILEIDQNFYRNLSDFIGNLRKQEFDGVAMMLVPVGCFMMGSSEVGQSDEQPVHQQCIEEPFWIDKTKVT